MAHTLLKVQIKTSDIKLLHLLKQDVRTRINSNYEGEYPDEHYIREQNEILDLIQEESQKRSNTK